MLPINLKVPMRNGSLMIIALIAITTFFLMPFIKMSSDFNHGSSSLNAIADMQDDTMFKQQEGAR